MTTNKFLNNIIEDLEKQLIQAQADSEWHHKKFKEFEEKVLNLKEIITELKSIKPNGEIKND